MNGAALPLGSSGQPGDGPDSHGPPIWPCSRWGLAAGTLPHAAGRSYRPISPLPARLRRSAVCFCATFRPRRPRYAEAWALPSTLSGGARTFLPETRSPAAATRPVRLSPVARLAWACGRVKQRTTARAPSFARIVIASGARQFRCCMDHSCGDEIAAWFDKLTMSGFAPRDDKLGTSETGHCRPMSLPIKSEQLPEVHGTRGS